MRKRSAKTTEQTPAGAKYLAPYEEALRQHGPTFKATLWRSEEYQRARFAALCEEQDFSGRVILDAGCARADFGHYLRNAGVRYGRYVGVDALEGLLGAARGANLPRAEFHLADFVADENAFLAAGRAPDVIVFSGSLNTLEQREAALVLDRAWRACAESLLFNFLSSRSGRANKSDPTEPAHRYDPLALLDWALSRTPSVRFRQEYLRGHDALIAMQKHAD